MSHRFASGLVVGKFAPLHLGHALVVRRAMEMCERVYMLSYTQPEFPGCEPARRARWLATLFPTVASFVVGHDVPPVPLPPLLHNDAPEAEHRDYVAWFCRNVFICQVEAVFGSDDYLTPFADHLTRRFREEDVSHPGVTAVMVDPARREFPASGTLLRASVHEHRHLLPREVYADFVIRICLLGGESSGKTTLAQMLARTWNTGWVPEFGREYWLEKGGHLSYDDLTHIGEEQCRREDAAAQSAHRFLFCDTSPLTTLFYCQHEFHQASDSLTALAARTYDWTFLCAPDFPFVQDGTRQPATFRDLQHAWYVRELREREMSHTLLSGEVNQRLEAASRCLERLATQARESATS